MILIGAGSMGGALLEAWLDHGLIDCDRSAVIDPRPSPEVEALCERHRLPLNPEKDGSYRVAILAVKPQQFPSVLPHLRWPGFDETLFLSIAAGMTVMEIGALLKGEAQNPKVLRVMPTLPAKVRAGVSLLSENAGLSDEDRRIGEAFMSAAGGVHWCKDEDELDRLMGVTGCAPAFFLRAVEALAEAAEGQGVAPAEARDMAEETFVATAQLLTADDRDAATLREAVTSPGGTTAAGLEVLEERGFGTAIVAAVTGAYRRAKELAGGKS
jgi:pyrroline-5-carboxylate reductase